MFIKANGKKLHYEVTGKGEPLILLHGNGENLHIFEEATAILKDFFTVYALDFAGHGESEAVKELHYAEHAADVYAFIRALSLEKPMLYGFSDGGIVGLMLAYQHPEVLGRLAVSGANLEPKGLKRMPRLGMQLRYAFLHDARTKMMLQEPSIQAADLEAITVPTLVLAGEFDLIKDDHTRFIASHIPDSTLQILKGETHGSYVVHSEKIARLLLNFAKPEIRF